MLTIQQLITPMTTAQARASLVTVLQGLGLQPQNWAPGGIASSILTGAATLISLLSTQLANAIAQMWNPTATGAGLRMLSTFFYGVTPPSATFATGSYTLVNSGGGVYTYQAGQAFFSQPGGAVLYTNVAAFTLNANSTISITIQATTVGSPGNANPGTITNLVTAMLGVTGSNPAAVIGIDAPSDAAVRKLNTDSISVRGNAFGPRGAYAYAISVAVDSVSGDPVNVNRVSVSPSSHTSTVTIYVAAPSGTIPTTNLEGMAASIDLLARPDAITVLPGMVGFPSAPGVATTVKYTAAIDVWIVTPPASMTYAPPTPSAVQTTLASALTTWFGSTANPIGGFTANDDENTSLSGIFESGIIGVLASAVVANFPGCTLLSTRFSNMTDLALTSNEVAAWAGTIASANLVTAS